MDDEFKEALEEETGLKIHRQMAYEGDPDCTSMMCRRMTKPPINFMGNGQVLLTTSEIEPGCMGWHCAQCDQPSSMYGHPEGECP